MNHQKPECPGASAGLCSLFALVAAIVRPLPTLLWLPFNFNPIGGLGLFGGARLCSWLAFVLPLAVMMVTDLFLWGYKGADYSPLHVSRPFVYGSFLLYVVIGRFFLQTSNPLRIAAGSLLGSLQFYLITNFQSWLQLIDTYPRTVAGLAECYLAGLPFYHQNDPIGFFVPTVLGDLIFTGVFFAIHALVVRSSEPAQLETAAQ